MLAEGVVEGMKREEIAMIEFAEKPDFKKRHHNLDRTRQYYNMRVNIIRNQYPFKVWERSSLNWSQHWDKFRVLLCNIYGVSCVDQIPDAFVDDANDFAIAMLTKMFDKNTEMLDLIEQEYLEEEKREEE